MNMSSSRRLTADLRKAPSCVLTRNGSVIVGGQKVELRSSRQELGDLKEGALIHILGEPVASGARVNEGTATGVPAFNACVRLISDMVAKLPINLYQRKTNGGVPSLIRNHPAIDVIRRPGEMHTEYELRRLVQDGEGLGGNGYARVYRNEFEEPVAMEWIRPCDIKPIKTPRPNGDSFISYKVQGDDKILTRYDIAHVMSNSLDGITGQSKVRLLKDSLGNSIAQIQSAGRLMKNGAKWPGYITVDTQDPQKLMSIRDEVNSNMAGVMNMGKIPVVGGNLTWHQTNGMSMTDAQFIENRRFELQEICRAFGIPPFMIGDTESSTSWGTGLEQQTQGFLNFALDPHLVAWEQSLEMTLLTTEERRQGFFFEFDRDKLMNASLEARGKFYETMRRISVYSVNDVREKLGEEEIEGGDNYAQPLNTNIKAESAPNPEPQSTNGE